MGDSAVTVVHWWGNTSVRSFDEGLKERTEQTRRGRFEVIKHVDWLARLLSTGRADLMSTARFTSSAQPLWYFTIVCSVALHDELRALVTVSDTPTSEPRH
jgi:hypothetical protein